MTVAESKQSLRMLMKQKLQHSSQVVCDQFLNWDVFLKANVVHCFMKLPHEIDLNPVIEECHLQGKTVAIPKFSKQTHHIELAVVGPHDVFFTGDFGGQTTYVLLKNYSPTRYRFMVLTRLGV